MRGERMPRMVPVRHPIDNIKYVLTKQDRHKVDIGL